MPDAVFEDQGWLELASPSYSFLALWLLIRA